MLAEKNCFLGAIVKGCFFSPYAFSMKNTDIETTAIIQKHARRAAVLPFSPSTEVYNVWFE